MTPSKQHIKVVSGSALVERLEPTLGGACSENHPARDLRWLAILQEAFGHQPYLLEITGEGTHKSINLPLCFVRSRLFGRFLVGLPYVNSGGCDTVSSEHNSALIDRAVGLAMELDCKHLELRHEKPCSHEALTKALTSKSHMRLILPGSSDQLWDSFKAKVRNQIRKGEKQGFSIAWGQHDLLDDFYDVFSRNMRDLGTPVFGKSLFHSVLRWLGSGAELCVIRDGKRPIACALLVFGKEVVEVPSASSLREYNKCNANMLMYWQLLKRACERNRKTFDFGRSTTDSSTYRFKKQWGATPSQAVWQYFTHSGDVSEMRKEHKKYTHMIRIWKELPLAVANRLGPWISKGIP